MTEEKLKYYYQDENGHIKASKENYPTNDDLTAVFNETGQGGADISISLNSETYTPDEEGVITLPGNVGYTLTLSAYNPWAPSAPQELTCYFYILGSNDDGQYGWRKVTFTSGTTLTLNNVAIMIPIIDKDAYPYEVGYLQSGEVMDYSGAIPNTSTDGIIFFTYNNNLRPFYLLADTELYLYQD